MMKIPLIDLKTNYLSNKKEIDKAIQNVIDGASFINGKYLKEFEKNYAKFCKAKHCIGAANGTAALHLSLIACGIKPNDEIVTVPNTFIATTECISYVNGKIKFVDVEEDTSLIDIEKLRKQITKKTKALIIVHLYGQMPNMDEIKDLADEKNLILIEDAAQAHASEWKGKKPGFYGDVASYSFFPAKNLGCFGDGGCVVTNNSEIAEKIDLMVNHGRKEKYEHIIEGYNYRLDTIQASILNAKLPSLKKLTEKKRKNALFYKKNLTNNVIKPVEKENAKHVYYMYVIRTKKRDKLKAYLKKQGISCGIHYPIPLHLQPAYKKLKLLKGSFPVSEMLSKEILSIPVYPELTQEQLEYIVEKINAFF